MARSNYDPVTGLANRHAANEQIERLIQAEGVWADAGHADLHVAVNVSAVQLRRGLKRQVDGALAGSGADPRCLEIEITEHSMVEDIASNVAQLAALGERGIRVAVDDFGTGRGEGAAEIGVKRWPVR